MLTFYFEISEYIYTERESARARALERETRSLGVGERDRVQERDLDGLIRDL